MKWLVVVLAVLAAPAHAVDPEERLTDPVLEQRARDLSKELRCVVCQNQSIDDSDATIAKDLRAVVRERITAGDDDAAIRTHLVQRYGEFVLLRPRWTAATLFLWLTPVILILGVLGWMWSCRHDVAVDVPLTADEERRLREL